MKKWVNWSIFGAVGLLLAVGTMLFHYFVLPVAIKYQVTKTLALVNGTDTWDRFVTTPIPLVLNVYFFHLENPDDLLHGGKPKLKEVGPYVYREYWTKVDIRVDEEKDRVFYKQKVEFVFDQELSGTLSDTDNVTLINPIIHVITSVIDGFPTLNLMVELLEFAMKELMGDMYGPSMTVSVHQLLLGGIRLPCGNDKLSFVAKTFCIALTNFLPVAILQKETNGDLVATFIKYKELSPLFEMNKGTKEPEQLGKIVSMDGLTHLGSWWCEEANIVDGYDMTMISPFVTRTSIPIFTYDLKTNVLMTYQKDSTYHGIGGYRFVMGPNLMGDPATNPKARCYCPGSANNLTIPKPCMKGEGVIDVASTFGVPVILSNPHFYGASENYLSAVDGLHPTAELHEAYVDVEPITGVPMNGKRRIQSNVHTVRSTAIKMLRNHTEAVVPLLWIDEGASLGPNEISMLRDQLLLVLNIENIIRWSLFAVGLLFLAIGSVMAFIRKRQEDNDLYDLEE